ncbi:hypothetical protein ACMGDM_01945 [Sphingomonas sp. DT-51]|uniref:hypothetical protein n=1 Tax=Sphingomonas sp. DT-51 TaxID=3396165 RepID=UPI003F1B9920
MSAVSDALAALKNVVLLQERLDVMRGDLARTAGDLRALTDKICTVDSRVLRIEAMIEMSRGGTTVPPGITA